MSAAAPGISIIDVLLPLANTVSWLTQVQPIAVESIPEEHIQALKQLESLGLIYRRNRATYSLQTVRLVGILKRASRIAPVELQGRCTAAYKFIFKIETESLY